MVTIALKLPEDQAQRLSALAGRLHITVEELAAAGVRNFLDQPDEDVQKAIQYVLTKNAELYRRLA
jgi:hypothetical protein